MHARTAENIGYDFAQAEAKVATVDLTKVKARLRDRFGEEQLDHIEKEYRRFLVMGLLYPLNALVPTADVDEMWHSHILFTRDYADDCKRVFGRFKHHEPKDFALMTDDNAKTAEIYTHLFGGEYADAGICFGPPKEPREPSCQAPNCS